MNENTMVSVVIPAYNAEDFIEDAVKSCFRQNYRPLEIVVVNDGSTDATVNKVKGLAESLPADAFKLRVIDIGKNMGAANALNVGFSSAEGKYICWLSADDVFIAKEKVAKQVAHMKRTRADWSYFRSCYIGTTLSNAKLVLPSYLPRLPVFDSLFIRNPDLRLAALLFRSPVNGSSVMISKDAVESYGQFDPATLNIDGDGDLWMRYSALKLKLEAVEGAPVFYREHGRQTSKRIDQMIYGCELTRIRILKALEKNSKLEFLIKKFAPFLPIILKTKQHFKRPMVSEFLFNYIIDNRAKFDWFLFKMAEKSLNDVRNHGNYRNIDKNKFAKDLELLIRSDVFKEFEEKLREVGCQ
jgi:glycosyltransferase involved in cell wall biosynthesis